MKQSGYYYIWLDATLVAGPFHNKEAALESLSPEGRKKWIWGFAGGMKSFLAIPTEAFSIVYSDQENPEI